MGGETRESRQQVGRRGEDLACAELQRQGLAVLARNWRCPRGEIDIVAADRSGRV
jgi:putative endonuclease